MKTRRTQEKKTNPKQTEEILATIPESEYTPAHADADMLYLKHTPYNKDTEKEIKLKLKRTAKHRQLLLIDSNTNMLANFPYLFVHHELVFLNVYYESLVIYTYSIAFGV